MRCPTSWLIVTTAPDIEGREIALLARASYDHDSDLLTITGPGGQREVTQGGGHSLKPLAQMLLREMFRKELGSANSQHDNF